MRLRRTIGIGFLVIVLVAATVAGGVYLGKRSQVPSPTAGESIAPLPSLAQSPTPSPSPSPTLSPSSIASIPLPIDASPAPIAIPESALITDVPFIPQAPHKNWDAIHEETCEEAAVLTVVHYWEGQRQPNPDEIETELQNLIAWEQRVLGLYEDTTASQTARILSEYFDYGGRVRVFDLESLEDIKREVAAGRPVIVPAAGRLLGNRHFKVPGPIYHMVVVIGYDKDEIITNDPGTQFGEAFRYPATTFWNAVHDFVDRTDEGMATGAKLGIGVDSNAPAD